MCKVLKVSSSSYYYWLHHPVSLREQKEQELVGGTNKGGVSAEQVPLREPQDQF
ncbi:hypothetical protein [Pontibacter qinzhouensis]|uniref:hypothetical protein n=1 Tax=Pontibacter qinzhouensis TaxID=2603253 RepID=UPI00164F85D4|nr:hypothetical protein [Pontibacter qinzhouensis]